MKTAELYQKPVYSEELFQSFYPMICKMIIQTTSKMPHDSENLNRFEDYVQMCRLWLWEHCDLYDPTRTNAEGKTAKFSTYMQMVFYSRLGAIRNNHTKKRKANVCVDYSNLGVHQYSEDSGEFESDISYVSMEESTHSMEYELLLKESLNLLQSKVSEEHFEIYKDFFVHDYPASSLTEKYPKYKYNQLRKIVNSLKEFHESIVGELC